MREFVLWGHRKGDPDWAEDVITVGDGSRFEEAKKWAIDQGFERFRVTDADGINPWLDPAGMVNKL
jgi:hypothetical protein